MEMSIHKLQQDDPFSLDSGPRRFYIQYLKQQFSIFCGVGFTDAA